MPDVELLHPDPANAFVARQSDFEARISQLELLLSKVGRATTPHNFFYNPEHVIWQRNTTANLNGTSGTSQPGTPGGPTNTVPNGPNTFMTDRWMFWRDGWAAGGFMYFVDANTDSYTCPAGTRGAVRLYRATGTAGTDLNRLGQCWETNDVLHMRGKTMTLSFWYRAYANYLGTDIGVQFFTCTDVDRNQLFTAPTGALTPLNTSIINSGQVFAKDFVWRRASFTFDVSNTARSALFSIYQNHSSATAVNDFCDYTGFQLEIGSVATPYLPPDPTLELARCQRYFYRTAPAGWVLATIGGTSYSARVLHPVPMQRVPTMIFSRITVGDGQGNAYNAAGTMSTVTMIVHDVSAVSCAVRVAGAMTYMDQGAYGVAANAELQ